MTGRTVELNYDWQGSTIMVNNMGKVQKIIIERIVKILFEITSK